LMVAALACLFTIRNSARFVGGLAIYLSLIIVISAESVLNAVPQHVFDKGLERFSNLVPVSIDTPINIETFKSLIPISISGVERPPLRIGVVHNLSAFQEQNPETFISELTNQLSFAAPDREIELTVYQSSNVSMQTASESILPELEKQKFDHLVFTQSLVDAMPGNQYGLDGLSESQAIEKVAFLNSLAKIPLLESVYNSRSSQIIRAAFSSTDESVEQPIVQSRIPLEEFGSYFNNFLSRVKQVGTKAIVIEAPFDHSYATLDTVLKD